MDTIKDKKNDGETGVQTTISADQSQKNIDPVTYFEKDADFVFVYKKTEKLATAVYMVTNLFSESEPLKWSLRKKVSDFLSFMLNYKETPVGIINDFVYDLKTRVLEIVSLLQVAVGGGVLSKMNFSILKQEFSSLISHFDSSNTGGELREIIPKNYFNGSPDYLYRRQVESSISQTSPNIKDKMPTAIEDKSLFKRSNRQTIILNLLKKMNELSIKDISQVIRDCSEKTIQRELISFISAGVLKRTGQRRWSKYSLNSS